MGRKYTCFDQIRKLIVVGCSVSGSCALEIAIAQSVERLTNGLKAFHTRPNYINIIAESNFPIHVIMGENDRLPGLSYCQSLVKTAKQGLLHIISSSGHYTPITNPQHLTWY